MIKTNGVKWSCPACTITRGQIPEPPLAKQINEDRRPNGFEDKDRFSVRFKIEYKWKVSNNKVSVDGYEMEWFDREGKTGRGLLLYPRS